MKTQLPKLLFSTLILILSTFFVKAACTASFTKSISGLTVTFTNTSTTTSGWPNMMMYNWNFGDGTYSTAKNPVKTYTSAGMKNVQLTINDSFGCIRTVIDTFLLVSSGPTCQASFLKSISGLTVSFTNTSTSSGGMSNVHYFWSFSNGQHSTLINPVTTFLAPGMQVAELTMYDSTTHCSSFFRDSILAVSPNNSCAANFTKSATGNTVVLTNMSTNTNGLSTGLSYYWYFNDGTSSTLKDPTKVFTTNGLKTISLTITDSLQGCFSTKVDSVMLPSGCAPSFNISVSGLTVTFTNTSVNGDGTANGLTYQWHFTHDNTNYTSKNITKTFPSIGYFPVRLSISDPSQGCSKMLHDTVYLSTSSACAANFSKSVSGLTVNFTNTSLNTNGSSTGLSYYWYFSDGTSSTLKNPAKVFTSAGVKTAQLTITDSAQGCFSTKTDTIMLASNWCNASFSKIASGLTVTFINASLNSNGTATGLNYVWSFGDGTSSTSQHPVKTYATAGVKFVTLSISDSTSGCFASITDTVLVSPPPPLCQASFTLATDTTTPFHFFLLNTSTILPGTTFAWDFGDSTTSTSMTPSHTYANFGYYFVCLTIFHPLCTTTFCDSIGMDSTGTLLKNGAFGFHTLDFTKTNNTTGTKETSSIPEYSIYPNPSNGDVFIEYTLQSATPLNIEVTDITGKVVKSKQANGLSGTHTEKIDIGDLQPAIYFMTIRTADMQKNYKVIKN